ncbi:MAG: PKD domain-containing protein [Clostridiales bacterium]|nr:PKD domain-containing protein [Clostridiales bacterium]
MKKFLILLMVMLLPLCASAAITVPSHITDVGAEAFAGTDIDALIVPAAVQTVGENVLAGSNASYLWLEGAATQVSGNPGVPFIFGPAGSAAANLSGFYAQESLVTDSGLYYALLEDKALPLCAVKPADISGSVTIPKMLNDLPVTSLDQLHLSNTSLTEVRIPSYLTAPEGLSATAYAAMSVDAPVASVTETPAGKYVTWTVSGYTGAYGDVSFVWTFENGGNTISTTTAEPTIKYAPMEEGSCTVTVRVVDSLNDWADAASEAITVTQAQPVYRALLVGNTYPGEYNALPGPDNDLKAMNIMLKSMTGTPYIITPANNLTASGIQSAIATTFYGAEPGDISLFYYSGHGTEAGALVGIKNTFLSVYGLRSALEKIPGTKIVLLDCCYSGAAINKSASTESVNLSAFNRAIISGLTAKTRSPENLADGGFIVLTASRKDQMSVSLSGGGAYWGVFTYGLCYGSGYDEWNQVSLGYLPADANGDGAITLGEAYNGVLERVNFLNGYASRNRAISQTPTDEQPNVQLLVEQATQYYGDTSFVLWKR